MDWLVSGPGPWILDTLNQALLAYVGRILAASFIYWFQNAVSVGTVVAVIETQQIESALKHG
jgi:hypothetical protein